MQLFLEPSVEREVELVLKRRKANNTSSSYNDFNNSSGSRYTDSGLISTDFHLLFRF